MAKLYVGSLPYSITDDSLLQLFSDRGYKPISARVITDKFSGQSKGFGFVELGPSDDMARAIGELNGLDVAGRAIQVNEARPQENRGGGGRGFGGGGGRGGFSGGRSGRGGRRTF
jgi:RNA recognition motif-containing protein